MMPGLGGSMLPKEVPESDSSSSSGSSSSSISNTSMTTLWTYAVVLQFLLGMQVLGLYQILLGANLNPTLVFTASLMAYLSLSIWAFFIFKSAGLLTKGDLQKLFYFLLISALYVFIPTYTYLLPKSPFLGGPSLSDWFQFLFYIVFPVWPIYIANHSGDAQIKKWTHNFVNAWIVFVLFVFIFFLASNINTAKIVEAGGRPEVIGGAEAFSFLLEKVEQTGKNFWKSINIAGGVKALVNATNLNYYTGTVDENEKAPVGLYISNVRTSDKYFYTDSPVTIWADLKGKSFTEEIRATPFCYKDKKLEYKSTLSPTEFNFFGEDQATLSCTFASLPKGSHSIIVGASFKFETWGYVTYTFVDQELDRAMQLQGKNINSQLDIPSRPEAVFTNGPVFLGMGTQIDMPIGIDVERNDRNPIVGVTVENRWSDGDLGNIDEFEIGVHDDFKLVDCDRWYPLKEKEPDSKKDGYSYYKFSKEDLEDQRAQFKSVTCRAQVRDPKQFLAGAQKVQRTFLSKVKYDYVIKKSIPVTVKE